MTEVSVFPDHLREPQRKVAAIDLARALGFDTTLLQALANREDDMALLDFWNLVCSYSFGAKLTAIADWLGAANCQLHTADMQLSQLRFYDVPSEVRQLGLKSPEKVAETQQFFDNLKAQPSGEPDQLLVFVDAKKEYYGIHVGNPSVMAALRAGQRTVRCWVLRVDEGRPKNFWIPTDRLIEQVRVARQDPTQLNRCRSNLRYYFSNFPAATAAYRLRVLRHEVGAELLAVGVLR